MMDNFKQELEALLAKYPDLGDFTIQVKSRVTILPTGNHVSVAPTLPQVTAPVVPGEQDEGSILDAQAAARVNIAKSLSAQE